MSEIKQILETLKDIEIKSNLMPFNMLYIAYQDVYGKEVLHSKLLAGLLNPNENHKLGDRPLKAFLRKIDVPFEELSKIKVETEKNVKGRRIDMLISWKDNNEQQHAVIIENKLHGAGDQLNQLNDYYNGVKKDYKVEKIVYLPFDKSRKTFEHTDSHDKVKALSINFDAKDIVNCIDGLMKMFQQKTAILEQYKEFFECLIDTKFTYMKAAEILQQLNKEDIFKLENLSKIMRSAEWCEALFTQKYGDLLAEIQQKVSNRLQRKFKQDAKYINYIQLYFNNWAETYWYEIWLYEDGFYIYKFDNVDYSDETHFSYNEENKVVEYLVPLLKKLSEKQ
jgi:hypothetical protein